MRENVCLVPAFEFPGTEQKGRSTEKYPAINILKGKGWQYIIRKNDWESSESDQEENQ